MQRANYIVGITHAQVNIYQNEKRSGILAVFAP